MTGLQKELKKNLKGKNFDAYTNTLLTYTGLQKLLGLSYPTIKRKVKNNSFSATEAICIFNLLFTENDYQNFLYLFTEIGE